MSPNTESTLSTRDGMKDGDIDDGVVANETLIITPVPSIQNVGVVVEKGTGGPTDMSMKDPGPPDGGYGWIVVIAICVLNAFTWGINATYGVYLSYYIETRHFPEATELQYALIGGLSISLAMFCAPIANWISRTYHYKITMSIGLFLQGGSFLLASFATKIWQLFLTQGAMFGAGMGLLFVAAAPLPNQWFNKRRALAMGICAAGSGAGGVLFSICTNLMIQNISLAWSFRITAICVFFVNTIVIIVIKDRIKVISARYRSFDLSLLRNMGFVAVILWGFVMLFGYVTVMYSLSDFAVSVGLSQGQGSVVTGMFSAGIMLGRPTMGFCADRIGRINLSIICTLGTAITCFVIWMFATSYGVMIFFALIHGALSGVFWTMATPVTAEVVGLQDLASALSLLWLLGTVIPTTFAEAIALKLKQNAIAAGKKGVDIYRPTIGFSGAMIFAGGLILIGAKVWMQNKRHGKTGMWRLWEKT